MYHPMKNMNNQEKNTYVRQHILSALLELMSTQDFAAISIQALVDAAGVGRASFYRNYKSKEDVLRQEAERLMQAWGKEFEAEEHTSPNELLISLLDFYKEHKEFYLAIHAAGMSDIVLNTILKATIITPDLPNAIAYLKSSIAYMIYGWVIEWMNRGMQESGTELARMIAEAQKQQE